MILSPETLALLCAVAFVAGGIDALAGGGALLTIPALLAAGIPPVPALATSKLQSTVGTSTAFLRFARAGQVDLAHYGKNAAGAFLGSALGATCVQFADPAFLIALVPVLLIAIGCYFLVAPPPGAMDRRALVGPLGLMLATTAIGFYDGFFGPGTGSFLTTALIALGGLGVVRAIANTKFINMATNMAGLSAMIVGGKVLWLPGCAMAIANAAGNQVGALLALRYEGRGVRPVLIVTSFALTIKLLARADNPVWAWAKAVHHWVR